MPKGDAQRLPAETVEEAQRLLHVGHTQRFVAQSLGIQRSTVGDWCRKYQWPTHRSGPRAGDQHTNWHGGRRLIGGYWYCYHPTHPHATQARYVSEHRLVMEQVLQRYLSPSEVVHHIDRNRTNNAPENLMVFANNGAHLRHELAGHTPQWSEAGLARIRIGVEKAATIRRRSRRDVPPPLQPTAHSTS